MLERVDAALAVFIEGVRRGPAGSALPGIAASNAYLCKDEGYALIAGNGDSIFGAWQSSTGRPKAASRRIDIGSRQRLKDDFDEH